MFFILGVGGDGLADGVSGFVVVFSVNISDKQPIANRKGKLMCHTVCVCVCVCVAVM